MLFNYSLEGTPANEQLALENLVGGFNPIEKY